MKKKKVSEPILAEPPKYEAWRRFVWLDEDIEVIPPQKPKKGKQ